MVLAGSLDWSCLPVQDGGSRFQPGHALHLAGAARVTVGLDAKFLETRHYEPVKLEAWKQGKRTLDIEDEHGYGTAVLRICFACTVATAGVMRTNLLARNRQQGNANNE